MKYPHSLEFFFIIVSMFERSLRKKDIHHEYSSIGSPAFYFKQLYNRAEGWTVPRVAAKLMTV